MLTVLGLLQSRLHRASTSLLLDIICSILFSGATCKCTLLHFVQSDEQKGRLKALCMKGSHDYGVLQIALRVMCAANHLCNTRQQDLYCCAAVSARKAAVQGKYSVGLVVSSYMAFCDGTSRTALGL